MPKRVSPIETIRADIDTVFGSGEAVEECLEELMRHSVRVVLQQVLKNDLEVFQNRDLTSIDLDYLFIDGSHFKMHDGTNAEPVMIAYAITTVSQPVLVAAKPAASTLPHPSGQKRTRQNPHQSSTNNQQRVLDNLR